jgi:YidC/Oxa1 family membrane protein insertase
MGATSFLQIAMTPQTGDKTQQRIMLFMPLMFFFFCYSFASALALYWTTSNIFAIVQTWITNRLPEPELKERKGGPRKSWVERFAAKQEELQRLQRERPSGANPAEDDKKKRRPPRTGG